MILAAVDRVVELSASIDPQVVVRLRRIPEARFRNRTRWNTASDDGGTNWSDISGALPQRYVKAIAVDRNEPNIAWLAFSGYRTAHVYRTSDFGATWEAVSEGLPDIPVNALLIDPSDRNIIYAGTDIGPFRYAEGRWEFIGAGMPPVVVTSFDVTANGRIVASTYGRGAYELVVPRDSAPRRRSVRK